MPWPIPTLPKVKQPEPISLRTWLSALTALAVGTAGAVLLLWPHGKPAQGFQFWALFIGVPLTTCALASGIRLDRWEREQTIAEEAEREQARIMSLWRRWSRRHVQITAALAVLPLSFPTKQLGDVDVKLPVNLDRSTSFTWTNTASLAWRRKELLNRIASSLQPTLVDRHAMSIKLLVDDVSLIFADAWREAAEDTFGKIMPGCNLNVEVERAVGCVQWLENQVELNEVAPQLIIAAQIWPEGAVQHDFSESAAAFLIDPAATAAGYIFRPMTVTNDTVETDVARLMDMQVAPGTLMHAWFTGCDDDSVAITSALSPDPRIPVTERHLDSIIGKPGPASSWIALAAALESKQGAKPHLVAWRESKADPLNLCMVSPAQYRSPHEELRT